MRWGLGGERYGPRKQERQPKDAAMLEVHVFDTIQDKDQLHRRSSARLTWPASTLWIALAVSGSIATCAQSLPDTPRPRASAASSASLDDVRALIAKNSFRPAELLLRTYLRTDEATADAHTLLGYTLMRLNQPKESLAEYTRAAQLRTPTAADLRSVGDDYALLADFADADHWMSQALLLDERDPEIWYSLGRIRYSRRRFQEAVQCFQKTLELLPQSVKAADNLGLAYEGLNRTEDATREYRRALAWQAEAAHPSEQPMLNLAIVLVNQGKTAEALPLLQQAATIAPADPRIHDQLGHLYLQQESLPEAQHEFEQAVALSPESGSYHFLLGQVYRRRGMAAQAQAEFARTAALNKTHSFAP